MTKLWFLLMPIMLSACVASHTKVGKLLENNKSIDKDAGYYLAISKDEEADDKKAQNTEENNRAVSTTIFEYMTKKGFNISMADGVETEKEALLSAKQLGFSNMIYPKVNDWRDVSYIGCGGRQGQLNIGLMLKLDDEIDKTDKSRDEADIDLFIYDVNSRDVVNSYNLYSMGCTIVIGFIPIGTMSPEGHLEKALDRWVIENGI